MEKDELSGSEAVYGLLGYLTSRIEPVTFSGKHDASPAANLADQFCEVNSLAEPRESWNKRLKHPNDELKTATGGTEEKIERYEKALNTITRCGTGETARLVANEALETS